MPINEEQTFIINKTLRKNPQIMPSKSQHYYDNGFDNIIFKYLFETSLFLINFFWDYLDKAIAEFVHASDYHKFNNGAPKKPIWKAFITVISNFFIAVVVGIPLLLLSFPFWFLLEFFKTRPYREIKKQVDQGTILVVSGRIQKFKILTMVNIFIQN